MTIVLDHDIANGAAPRALPALAGPARPLTRADLPDLHQAPKRRLHPMLVGLAGFALASGAFYGSEAVAPAFFKPSTIIGGYQHEIAEAHKSGELNAQVRYDAQLRGIELQYQGQLKDIETAAVQWQENYKSQLSGYIEDYRGAWSRANIFAQTTADLQKQYAGYRLSVMQGTLGGETSMANAATMLGLLGGLFSPDIERRALEYADQIRARALSKLDQAALSGITVSIEGWNEGLPDPDALAERIRDLPPLRLPPLEHQPISVPAGTER